MSNHRGHGHCIAKGADLIRMMADLFGRRDGLRRGKGGLALDGLRVSVPPATGIVGSGLPIAMGAAYTSYLPGANQVLAALREVV